MSANEQPETSPSPGQPAGASARGAARFGLAHYVTNWKLKDGTQVTIRPIHPTDEALMVRFHQTLSDNSVYFRYLGPLKLSQRIEHRRLIKVCLNDYDHELALVVEKQDLTGGNRSEILGVGRLIKFQEQHEAEFAVVVSDAFQGSGLGLHLMRRLIRIARHEGHQRLIGYVLPDNRAMLHICEKLGFRRIHPMGDPVVKVELALRPGGVSTPGTH
jgi:acetyltransferase